MDFAALMQEVSEASLFDLHRIRAALNHMIDEPARIERAKAQLRVGTRISYFEDSENRLIEAVVLELNRTRLLVENVADKKRWSIYYSAVNLEGADVDVPVAMGNLDRTAWKVGDLVAFRDNQNRDRYGTIASLNPKTATVVLKDNHKWRVAYRFLIPVWEGEARSKSTSEHTLPMGRTLRVIEACEPEEES
jgi:hypothetical protein